MPTVTNPSMAGTGVNVARLAEAAGSLVVRT